MPSKQVWAWCWPCCISNAKNKRKKTAEEFTKIVVKMPSYSSHTHTHSPSLRTELTQPKPVPKTHEISKWQQFSMEETNTKWQCHWVQYLGAHARPRNCRTHLSLVKIRWHVVIGMEGGVKLLQIGRKKLAQHTTTITKQHPGACFHHNFTGPATLCSICKDLRKRTKVPHVSTMSSKSCFWSVPGARHAKFSDASKFERICI